MYLTQKTFTERHGDTDVMQISQDHYDRLNICAVNSCVETIPVVMVLGSEASAWHFGHQGRAVMHGISVLILETPENSLAPPTIQGNGGKTVIYQPESGLSPGTKSTDYLSLDFPASIHMCEK